MSILERIAKKIKPGAMEAVPAGNEIVLKAEFNKTAYLLYLITISALSPIFLPFMIYYHSKNKQNWKLNLTKTGLEYCYTPECSSEIKWTITLDEIKSISHTGHRVDVEVGTEKVRNCPYMN